MNNKTEVITFGCRVNTYESAVIKKLADKAGLENVIIVNTCTVTGEAERQARQAIRKLRKENPDTYIIVTGCAAQIAPEKFAQMPEVDSVLGNLEKMDLDSYSFANKGKKLVGDIMENNNVSGHYLEDFEGRTRAFVQVQHGCDWRCTYCIVPYARGASYSEPLDKIIAQTKRLVDNGYREIVLAGVDLSSYGKEANSPSLSGLVKEILEKNKSLERLRLSSLDPAGFDEELIELINDEPRIMPHIHLSIQAGDNLVLKRMGRRHLREDVIELCKKLRSKKPDMAIGADIITGFPTETDEMFENSVRLVDECFLTHLHVFTYSPRQGTPAAKMPAVKKAVAKQRAAVLREKGEQKMLCYLDSFVGKKVKVLIEKTDGQKNKAKGHSEHFVMVEVDGKCSEGQIIDVNIKGIKESGLYGNILYE